MTACDSLLLRKFCNPPTQARTLHPSNQVEPCAGSNGCPTPVWGSLQLCTEGLGFESSQDMRTEMGYKKCESVEVKERGLQKECINDGDVMKRGRLVNDARRFPPPISCIGRGRRPWVCFETYKEAGRFVLREIRVQSQEVLQARREGGRLMLSFVQMDDETFEERHGECDSENEDEDGDEDGKDQEKSDEEEIL